MSERCQGPQVWLTTHAYACMCRRYLVPVQQALDSDHIGLPKSSLSSANLYDWNAEPAEQARLCSAQFADPVIVAAVKTNTATSVFAGH